jgi:protein-S-isoprenylcysteine O-methyltransferase Ste14
MHEVRAPFLQLYRINALRAFGVLAFGLLIVTAPPAPLPLVDLVLDTLGTLAVFVAIAGRAWSLFYIGGRKNSELVTHGPYSLTRNPLYFFSLVGIVGVAAQTGSLLWIMVTAPVAYCAFEMAIRGEEAYLAERYAGRFRDYCAVTPRLLPNLALWRECEDVPLSSARALGSFRDGIVFLAAWTGIEMIGLAQAAGVLPVFWTLPI